MKDMPLIVTTDWLAEHAEDPGLRIIDATVFMSFPEAGGPPNVESGKQAFTEGHIPGAAFADLAGELSDTASELPFMVPPREVFIEKLEELGIGDGTFTVIYDRNALAGEDVAASYWASRLAWQMRYEGFSQVAVLEGGQEDPVALGEPRVRAGRPPAAQAIVDGARDLEGLPVVAAHPTTITDAAPAYRADPAKGRPHGVRAQGSVTSAGCRCGR